MAYYNTTRIEGNDLRRAHRQTETQQEKILSFFKKHWIMAFTPFDVQAECLPDAPITSVRRAITNLTDDNRLVKLQEYKIGKHGKRNHKWQYLFPVDAP